MTVTFGDRVTVEIDSKAAAPDRYRTFTWYGRGPVGDYGDRKDGTRMGGRFAVRAVLPAAGARRLRRRPLMLGTCSISTIRSRGRGHARSRPARIPNPPRSHLYLQNAFVSSCGVGCEHAESRQMTPCPVGGT
ncbi:hypothetical protein G3I70_44140 [Actinomadura bangladeshensis]|uniref:Uncharacterized protein n=1 Tax=Actinomadura bangladeshensis TaxID=453573 RepID=A0A6L9QVB9_9ACTN|nr:hypothetical protein [Actinomadura bangladeshensis]